MHSLTPYIGITDFTHPGQVRQMLRTFQLRPIPRKLHVGVMMSRKTLNGLGTKWAIAFPAKETISDIFYSEEAYNCLHYADSERDPDLAENLSSAIGWGRDYIDAVQLDLTWPEPAAIADGIRCSRKKIEVILQIGQRAFNEVNNDPAALIAKLEAYTGIIHRVLLDKSMGQGKGMDAKGLIPFARAIRNRFPDMGIGAAGGLGPDTMHLVEPLLAEFPDLSWDAQGRLRRSGDALNDPIEWDLAETYVTKSVDLALEYGLK